MTMPGCAPSTPASQVPWVLVTTPFLYSLESSPKYQTLPASSWAYQSVVFSSSVEFTVTVSDTTMQRTPRMVLVCFVTVTTTCSGAPSLVPS
jgi:hypothetical protein